MRSTNRRRGTTHIYIILTICGLRFTNANGNDSYICYANTRAHHIHTAATFVPNTEWRNGNNSFLFAGCVVDLCYEIRPVRDSTQRT